MPRKRTKVIEEYHLTSRGMKKLALALDDVKFGRVKTWEQVKKELDKR